MDPANELDLGLRLWSEINIGNRKLLMVKYNTSCFDWKLSKSLVFS